MNIQPNNVPFTLFTFLLLLVTLLAACSTSSELLSQQLPAQSSEPLKVGVALPLTGSWAIGGEAVYKGIQVARDEINVAGGIDGRPIELLVEDTHSKVPDAVTAVTKLIDVDKVPVVLAGALSAEAVAVAPIAQEKKVVLLSPLALTTPLETAGEWVFKLRESSRVHARKTLEQVAKRGLKQLGIISQHYEACDDILSQMQKHYAGVGITPIAMEKYEPSDTDFRTQLSKLKQADPDAIFVCGLYQDGAMVFKQAKELGIKKPYFTMVAVENKKVFEIAGDAAEGAIFTTSAWSCKNAKGFCKAIKGTYGADPDYRSAFGYDALNLVAEAVRRRSYSAEGIQQGLLSIQDYLGAGGKTSFDAEGNAQKEVIVKQVKGNQFVNMEE